MANFWNYIGSIYIRMLFVHDVGNALPKILWSGQGFALG